MLPTKFQFIWPGSAILPYSYVEIRDKRTGNNVKVIDRMFELWSDFNPK
jgi:hypothetical protein